MNQTSRKEAIRQRRKREEKEQNAERKGGRNERRGRPNFSKMQAATRDGKGALKGTNRHGMKEHTRANGCLSLSVLDGRNYASRS